MKKIIAISQRVDIIKSYGETRDALDQNWAAFLAEINCIPLILPNHPESAEELLNRVKPHGCFITGGSGPVTYGGNSVKRDETDRILLEYAIQNKIPLVGVCRGLQFIAHFFGYHLEEIKGHVATKHQIFGEDNRQVNSYHNWGIPQVDETAFSVFARSEEELNGFVEGMIHVSEKIMGIMWHPERCEPFEPMDIQLIQNFLEGKED